jgi:superfamily I DNA/RNA helicase
LKENLRNSQQIAHAVSKFVEKPTIARGPYAFEIEYVDVGDGETFDVADDVVANLTDKEFWHPGEIALLTTKKRHPEHERQSNHDRVGHWDSLWASEDVFYCTVGGFKGLERSVVVLAIDGFHDDSDQDDVLYVGMSRARDKLVVVATSIASRTSALIKSRYEMFQQALKIVTSEPKSLLSTGRICMFESLAGL